MAALDFILMWDVTELDFRCTAVVQESTVQSRYYLDVYVYIFFFLELQDLGSFMNWAGTETLTKQNCILWENCSFKDNSSLLAVKMYTVLCNVSLMPYRSGNI